MCIKKNTESIRAIMNYAFMFFYHTLVIFQSIMLLILSTITVLIEFKFFDSASIFTLNLQIFSPFNITIGLFYIYIALVRPISCKYIFVCITLILIYSILEDFNKEKVVTRSTYLIAILLSVFQILSQYTRYNMIYETFVTQSVKIEKLLVDSINQEQLVRAKQHIYSIQILSESNLFIGILCFSLMKIFNNKKTE